MFGRIFHLVGETDRDIKAMQCVRVEVTDGATDTGKRDPTQAGGKGDFQKKGPLLKG